jgi:predicted amidohydrolase YtcJ
MKKTLFFVLLPLGALLTFVACNNEKAPTADYIIKGIVRTMEEDAHPVLKPAECIATAGDKILFIGSYQEAKNKYFQEGQTKVIDCSNNLILPGFIDAHAHVGLATLVAPLANLSGPPYGTDTNIDSLTNQMKAYISKNYVNHPPDAMVIGNNYDDAQLLPKHQQPTKEDLDKIDPTHPIYIVHVSGHMGVANSKFLSLLHLNDNTAGDSIPGGTIVKANGKLTGLLLENANLRALQIAIGKTTPPGQTADQKYQAMLPALKQAENEWFQYGVTTICEGRADPGMIDLIMQANKKNQLTGDFIVLPDFDSNKDNLEQYKKYYNKYTNHFKIGGVKFTFDGSPQGKDAFLSQPYQTPMIGQDANYHGHPIYPYDSALKYMESVEDMGMPVHVHLNGDSAIDMALSIFKTLKAKGKLKQPTPNVLIHCQLARKDQLETMKSLKPEVMESFFPTHVYVWGDWYWTNVLDTTRAKYISPLKDADDYGLDFTIHTDAPITPPDLLAGVYAAVNRRTQTGMLLGGDQRISVYRALRAITKGGAYQWGEQSSKGMLKPGYKADIVVLSNDILKRDVDPMDIRKSTVMYTFKDGKQVYIDPNIKQVAQ